MATYVIGDVQGCFDRLLDLLEQIDFSSSRDRLWFTGDLVNRGPQSLDVLRFVSTLGQDVVSVLGNHDLHLLAVARGAARPRQGDTLAAIMRAPDRDELLDWLRRQPLLARDDARGFVLVHAGLLPQWDIPKATALAAEVEQRLRSDLCTELLTQLYGNRPDTWRDDLRGWARLRLITNVLTRIRYCDRRGRLVLGEKAVPGEQPAGLTPWFAVANCRWRSHRIVFGHWSSVGPWQSEDVIALDSGCVWGGQLSAARVDVLPIEITSTPCAPKA